MSTKGPPPPVPRLLPAIGCLSMALALCGLCLMPFFLADIMQAALQKLDLSPPVAVLFVFGIFLGGLVNVPVYRIPRTDEQLVDVMAFFGLWGLTPRSYRLRRDTVIAVNLGGCVLPSGLALWEGWHLLQHGGWPLTALVIAALGNVLACYLAARPVSGVGITMPGLLSPLVSVGFAWLLLSAPQYDLLRAPVAFVAGVIGPLIGADLLHLKDISRISTGFLSIGGAGTFDGIVLSGVMAALLA